MDPETGYVDNLFEKPKSGVHRNHGNTRSSGTGFNPTVFKIVKGDAVSKNKAKSMASSFLEDFAPEVTYSLKKKNRWQELGDVDSVLNSVMGNSPSFTVSAVEKGIKRSRSLNSLIEDGARVYGRIKKDSDKIEKTSTKSGNEGALLSLQDSLDCKNERSVKKKKSEREAPKPREPEITLIIDPQGDTQKAETSVKGKKQTQRSNKFNNKLVNEDEKEVLESGDSEIFDEGDEDVINEVDDLIEKSNNFHLSDFIKPIAQKKERIHHKKIQNIEFVDEIPSELLSSKNNEKPLDQHEILKDFSHFSKVVKIHPFLKSESFANTLEEYVKASCSNFPIMWMNDEKTKCVVDFSNALNFNHLLAVVGLTVFTKKENFLRITLNTDFPVEFENLPVEIFSNLLDYIVQCLKKSFASKLSKSVELSSLHEAFLHRCDTTVEPYSEYDLLKKFSESVETPLFDSFHTNSCELCGHDNSSNIIQLSCIHSLCLYCAKFTFKEQIIHHSEELVCPICDSTQDPIRLTFAVPLPLIKAFLKDNFRRHSKNGIQECPNCLAYFEKVPETTSISCKKCCISFCPHCIQPPHFPLSCDQMKIWLPRFQKQYKIYSLKDAPKYGLCSCGDYVELPTVFMYYRYARCNGCNCSYFGKSSYVWTRWTQGTGNVTLEVKDFSELPTYISKPFIQICGEAKKEIKDGSRVVEIRKCGREFLDEDKLNEFIILRFKILKLIEYGTAWLYFNRKNEGSDQNKGISKALKEMKFLLDSVIIQFRNSDHHKSRHDLKSLQDLYSKAVTMF